MSGWKFINHGGPACGKAEIEGPEGFVRFMFEGFEAVSAENYAELVNAEGNVVATIRRDEKAT